MEHIDYLIIGGGISGTTAAEVLREKEALVIGEGFIALEFAETFILNGFRAHLLERGEVWGGVDGRFGKSGGEMLEENFKRHGVTIHKNVNPEAIGDLGIKASLAGVGIGIKR